MARARLEGTHTAKKVFEIIKIVNENRWNVCCAEDDYKLGYLRRAKPGEFYFEGFFKLRQIFVWIFFSKLKYDFSFALWKHVKNIQDFFVIEVIQLFSV